MAGSRSVWMPVRLTKPSTSTRMTATRMVNGFLTLYFGMEVFPFFSDRPVGRIYYSTLTAGCKGLRVQRAMELLRASASVRWPTARRWCAVLH